MPSHLNRLEMAGRSIVALGLSMIAIGGGMAAKEDFQGYSADNASAATLSTDQKAKYEITADNHYAWAEGFGIIFAAGTIGCIAGSSLIRTGKNKSIEQLEEAFEKTPTAGH